jgi:hypothetical protein
VRPLDHGPAVANACTYHWGKSLYRSIGGELLDSFILPWLIPLHAGERTRTYTCCSQTADGAEGCTRGPHVFYETDPSVLHERHPFSETSSTTSSALEVAALDCEMIYTTGGFRIARVSVVDASGESVFDEYIKMDDGVKVVCVISLPYPPLTSHPNTIRVSLTRKVPQGFELALLRYSCGRVRSTRNTTTGIRTACIGAAHWRGYDPDRACARQ